MHDIRSITVEAWENFEIIKSKIMTGSYAKLRRKKNENREGEKEYMW